MQFTIETRQLTTESPGPPFSDGASHWLTFDAVDSDDAISQFLRGDDLELVSVTQPLTGRESIATVRKDDRVFLVRIYAQRSAGDQ